ncbi:hypothetical protein ANCDUO_19798 [Ancylostoma duodenale]|uniref:CUB domain-containing protein n=1 Tax=Ancylostoma duodenale TaxID=51022 RepID=A0A0C2FZ40_9BILA|nr:hypothetical protein ANCDUO_19798 [Ancylostoma duodenale]
MADFRAISSSLDCDEFLEGYGGEIKMDGSLHLINTYVDCIWIVGRFPHMARTFDRIYLKCVSDHVRNRSFTLFGVVVVVAPLLFILDFITSCLCFHITTSGFYLEPCGVEEFHMKGVGLRLEVREGASSTSDRILLLFDSQTRDQLEHKQPRYRPRLGQ